MAPDNQDAIFINQDAWFSLGNFSKNFTTDYQIKKSGNGVYVFVLSGNVIVNDQALETRDGLGIWDTDSLQITASTDAAILLIDVPMQLS